MRAVVQRTTGSRVSVDGQVVGEIRTGLTVLWGVRRGDTEKDAEYLVDKIINMRIFEDEQQKLNLSLLDVKGELLLISQFTLYGDMKKGRRPSFDEAAGNDEARPLYEYALAYAKSRGIPVAAGIFGADMKVEILNDGPVTILLDSEKRF